MITNNRVIVEKISTRNTLKYKNRDLIKYEIETPILKSCYNRIAAERINYFYRNEFKAENRIIENDLFNELITGLNSNDGFYDCCRCHDDDDVRNISRSGSTYGYKHDRNCHECDRDRRHEDCDHKRRRKDCNCDRKHEDCDHDRRREDYSDCKPYEIFSKFHVENDSYNILSIKTDYNELVAGRRGRILQRAETWGIEHARRISLANVFENNPNYEPYVINEINRRIDRQVTRGELEFFINYPEKVREFFNPENFFIRDGKLFVFYQAYEIAPLSSGPIMFEINVERIKDEARIGKRC